MLRAVRNENADIVKFLLDHGADVNQSAKRRVSSGFLEILLWK